MHPHTSHIPFRIVPLLAALLVLTNATTAFGQRTMLSFEDAVRAALERNERTKAADLQYEAADSRLAGARAAFFPNLSLAGTYTRRAFETVRLVGGDEITIQSLNAFSASANASLTLIDPRLFPLYTQVRSDRDASQAAAMNAARLIAFEAASAFLAAFTAEQVQHAAERRLEYAVASLDASRARFNAQLVSVNDVTRAELEHASAERDLTAARGERETSRLRLAYVINDQAADSLLAPDELLSLASMYMAAPDRLVERALQLRADVSIARARGEGLHASATEALMRLLPSIVGVAQYRWTNEAGFSGKSTNWYVGANLAWTLFDGGKWIADRSERSALAAAADLETQAIERQVTLDIRSSLVALTNARAARDQAAVAYDAAKKNASESLELYRQGLVGALAAADANVRLYEADVAYTQARIGLVAAFLNLRAAIGFDPLGNDLTRKTAE